MNTIQFSPIRSGSTLVYNYLLGLNKNPLKIHNYVENIENKYVITVRHPYNAIISSILKDNCEISIEMLKLHTHLYLQNGGVDILINNINKNKHCVLLYEDFINNHDIILNTLEEFFNEKYSDELRSKLKSKFNINKVKKEIENNNLTDFWKHYDKKTHFHGRHISKYNGETDYKKILKREEINILEQNNYLNYIIEKYYHTCKKVYIITGPESSGSVFISKVIANYVGATKNIDDWNGYGYCNSINPDIKILHRSQPFQNKNQYFTLNQFEEEFKGLELYFILTTRYIHFSNLSKKSRFGRTEQDIENNMLKSKSILSEIINSNKKYFIWNYETMMYLNEVYFDLLYNFVDGVNKFYPKIIDGNIKYLS